MCYCCKERTIRILMWVFGALVIIPGILLFIFGGLFAKDLKPFLGAANTGGSIGDIAKAITFVFAAMAVYIGAAGIAVGCCFTKCPKLSKCCACLYSIKSFIFFAVFIILGIVFIAISSVGVKYIKQFCDGSLDQSKLNDSMKNVIKDITSWQDKIAAVPTQTLCTTQCPCVPQNGTYKNWTDLFKTSDAEIRANRYSRTAKIISSNPNQTVSAANTSQTVLFLGTATTKTVYDSYWACVTQAMLDQANSQNTETAAKVTAVSDSFKTFAENLESAFNCNGICDYGLFYYFKKVTDGPPTQNCVDGVLSIFKDKPLGIGILLLISFVLTVVTHLISWGMCCRCCGPKEEKNDWK